MKIILTVTPSQNPDSSPAYTNRGQLFDATLEDTLVVRRSPQPLLDAARILLAAGADPATPIAMRHAGAQANALTATVGAAAGLTVWEGDTTPRLRQWKPHNYVAQSSPSDFPDPQARGVAGTK